MAEKYITPPKRDLAKSYEPQEFEAIWAEFWEKSGCFKSSDENAPGQKSFSIMIPPPNVTGVLHMGHALTNSIQDFLIRWHRMLGDNTLWLPGTDHAGIATQVQVERAIAQEMKGKDGGPMSRHELGRDKFLERAWKWKEDHHDGITGQMRRFGASVDWSRERFTLDEGLSVAVRDVFVQLYNEGLIYRGERIINWCPVTNTALSDLEVEPTETKGHLWHLIYPVVNKSGEKIQDENGNSVELTIATTRPETMLGDTAVAVHPEDERYINLHGQFIKLPIMNRLIPIITDEYVDREFGTGALKITPAHDFNDYDLGKKHNLPFISVIGKDGKITDEGGDFAGQDVRSARKAVVERLKELGALGRIEDHTHMVGYSQRAGVPAEPVVSMQWFVDAKTLAKPAIEAVESKKIIFKPEVWEKTYFDWMYNIRDWCISRQLWWGHQIPAWHCQSCAHITVAKEPPRICGECKSTELKQDEDVLDTWFSSALWPFSTLNWPTDNKALKTFYPNSVMETGFDIIFFWVARMIMMGMHFMKDVPFHKVYLHAMVRDENGAKMSKSKGNVIDPLTIMDKQGTDPLRFTLAVMAGQGRDIKLSLDRVEGYRAFCNKIWNATKFTLFQFEQNPEIQKPDQGLEGWIETHFDKLLPQNRWIISELQMLSSAVNAGLENFEINVSAQSLYEYTWGEFCDWYIELSKLPLRETDESKKETLYTLRYCLENILKLLHPFIPFVTEELWQALPWIESVNTPGRIKDGELPVQTIMLQKFPVSNPKLIDQTVKPQISMLKTTIDSIRNFRGENSISPKNQFLIKAYTNRPEIKLFLTQFEESIRFMTRISGFELVSSKNITTTETVIPVGEMGLDLIVDLKGLVDVDAESKRVEKEIKRLETDIEKTENKLKNPKFVERAPVELVEKEKARAAGLIGELAGLKESLKRLLELKN